jgi:hypothetical protein
MNHRFLSLAFSLSTVVSLVACSSGTSSTGPTSTSGGSPSGSTTPGSGGGTTGGTANGESCSSNTTNECSNYFCRCADNAVVNSSLCTNGQCQVASQHCETACQTFKHGKWAGTAGGGPSTAPPTPPPSSGGAIEANCAREQAAGCGSANCVSQLNTIKAKCSAELETVLDCAATVAACTSQANCASELSSLKQCLAR